MTAEDLWLAIPPINLYNINTIYALYTFKFTPPEITDYDDQDRQEDYRLQSSH
jgi:hypothetical protein